VNDVYGGTFRYMTRVAKENQGLETTFVDLENADEEQVKHAIRDNTKARFVRLLDRCFTLLTSFTLLAHMDRVPHQPNSSLDRHTPHCCDCTRAPIPSSSPSR
jgi:hypothetical protein